MPVAYSAGAAYLQILPSLRGAGTSIERQLGSELRGVGASAGTQVGQRLGTGLSGGLVPALRRMETALATTAQSGSGSMTTLARGTAPVLDQLAKVNPALGRIRDGFGSAQVAGLALSGTAGTLGGRLRTVVDTTSRVGSGIVKMGQTGEGVFRRLGSTIGGTVLSPLSSVTGLLGRYGFTVGTALAFAGGAAVKMGVQFAASQEQATMAFATMLHSGQAAQQFMAQLQAFAAKTPFDLPDVVTGAQRLMAFGFSAKQVLPTLTAIGDAVSGLGGSAEQINDVTIAIGQMSAKGKVQGDEILQLTEAGIPALRILANQMGVTTGSLQTMITKGLVPSSKAIPLLLSGLETGTRGAAGTTQAFAGMMSTQATTLTGIWSNFKDNANRALGQLITPALPAIKSGLTWLTSSLGLLPGLIGRFTTAARPIEAVVAPAFRDVGRFLVASVLPALRNLWTAVQPVAVLVGGAFLVALRLAGDLLANTLGPALVTVSTWLRPLMPVVVGIAAAFGAWFGIALAVAAVTRAIALVRAVIVAVRIAWLALQIAFETSPIGLIITLLAGLAVGLVYAWTHFQGFRDAVTGAWRAVQQAASYAWNSILRPALLALGSAASTVASVFVTAWRAVESAAVVVASALVTAWHGVVVAVQAVGAAASWLWSTVLSPVFRFIYTAAAILFGILVTAVLTPIVLTMKLVGAIAMWLWQLAFRPMFALIGAAAIALWNAAIKPAFDGIAAGVRAVGALAAWLWHNAIQPAIAGIGALFSWLWANAIRPAIGAIVTGARGVGSIAVWLWHSAIQPALAGVGALFSWLWTNAVRPALVAINTAERAVGSLAIWLWHSAVEPAWRGIGAIIKWAWSSLIAPAFGGVRSGVSGVGSAFSWVYQNVIRPAWSAMGTAVRAVYDSVLHPAFEAVKSAVHAVGSAFSSVASAIGTAWSKIKSYAAVPINWVIDHVWNHGIRDIWNAVTGWIPGINIKLGTLKPIAFASGGVLPGYAPGRDSVQAMLSPGEAVLVPELVRLIGPDNILSANAAARRGQGTGPTWTDAGLPGFFLGGLWNGLKSLAGGIGHVASSIVGGVKDAATFIAHFTTDPLGTITSMLPSLKGLTQFASTGWGKAIAQLPGAAIGGLISTVKQALGLADDGRGGPAPKPAATGGGDVDRWRGLVQQTLVMLRQPLTLIPHVLRRMNQESGGNPRAINLTDINARRGTPSIGLMQVIRPTFLRWRNSALSTDIYDPAANIFAGLNYAEHSYPSLQYAMDKPGGYDGGGWLPPGLSTVYNGTRRPEAVFTGSQLDALTAPPDLAGLAISGRLELGADGMAYLVDGRIDAALDSMGTALARRTR